MICTHWTTANLDATDLAAHGDRAHIEAAQRAATLMPDGGRCETRSIARRPRWEHRQDYPCGLTWLEGRP